MAMTEEMKDRQIEQPLSTTDMPVDLTIFSGGGADDSGLPPTGGAVPPGDDDIPLLAPKGSSQRGRLIKNEDKEAMNRFIGATYEVRQFSLWENKDMKAYQDLMSSVGTDKFSRVVFQDRVYVEQKQSWKILIEIEHFTIVAR